VILAVIIFRSEDFMRRMDQARQTRAEETARRNEQARAQREADLVIITTYWGSWTELPDGKMRVNDVRRMVRNSSTTQTITQVEYRHPIFQPEFALIARVLSPGEATADQTIGVNPFDTDQDNSDPEPFAEVRFQADGRRWQKRGHEPATLLTE